MLVLFIIPPFLLVGIDGLRSINSGGADVAKVGEKGISQAEWENSQRVQLDNFRARLGQRFDPKMFETPEMKQRMLDTLVDERVASLEMDKRLINISDKTLEETLKKSLGGMVGPDGKFNRDEYLAALAKANMTAQQHQEGLRRDMRAEQFNSMLQGSAFMPRSLSTRISDIFDQEREVQELVIKSTDFMDKVKVTPEMVKEYYGKNGKKFETPEQASIDYVVLNYDAISAQIEIKEDEIKAAYEGQKKERFSEPEQRRASHILVKLAKDAKDPEKAAAKAKAEKLLAQVKANKADFAKLAKENSDDPGSGSQGGDLGFFGDGMMVQAFDAATKKLQKDEISDLVLSEFGYHIIMLTDVKAAKVKPFDEVKAEILAELRRKKAEKSFADYAEAFNNGVDEQTDGLKGVAENAKLKLKIQSVADVGRNPNPSLGPDALYNNPKFLKALFEKQDVLKGKRNTEVVEIAASTLIAAHVKEYKPAKVRPLTEVEPAIRDFLTKVEATNLAKKEGMAKVAALKAKDDAAGFGEMKTLSRSKAPTINASAAPEVLKADASKLPAFVGFEIPGQGYAVYRIAKVGLPAAQDLARRKSEQEQMTAMLGQTERFAGMEYLKAKNKVKILQPVVPATPAASSASASASAEASAK